MESLSTDIANSYSVVILSLHGLKDLLPSPLPSLFLVDCKINHSSVNSKKAYWKLSKTKL